MNYTSKEQSKKLIELGLSPETADMYYEDDISIVVGHSWHERHTPCWSVGALLGVLPDNCGINKEDGKYVASYLVSDECGAYTSDNPVDACVSMIEYLHELKRI